MKQEDKLIIDKIDKLSDGNWGVVEALCDLKKYTGIECFAILDEYKIYGHKIYKLWNDGCHRNAYKMKQVLMLLKNKVISIEQVAEHLNQQPIYSFDEIILKNIYSVLINKEQPIKIEFLDYINVYSDFDTFGKEVVLEIDTYKAYVRLMSYLLNEKSIRIGIESGTRSFDEQEIEYKKQYELHGEEYAKFCVAPVGASEHHSGLSIDLNLFVGNKWCESNLELHKQTKLFEQIHLHLHKFGFILRYPDSETVVLYDQANEYGNIPEIFQENGIPIRLVKNSSGFVYLYEPWHIRYVGESLATYLFENNMTLDEYHTLNTK